MKSKVALAPLALAVLTWGLGDIMTTIWILRDPSLAELNPLIDSLGIPFLLAGKILGLGLAAGLYVTAERVEYPGIEGVPVAFASVLGLMGCYAFVNNIPLFA